MEISKYFFSFVERTLLISCHLVNKDKDLNYECY